MLGYKTMRRVILNEMDSAKSLVCDSAYDYVKEYVNHYDLNDDALYILCTSVTVFDFVTKRQSDPSYSNFGEHVLNRIASQPDFLKDYELWQKIKDIPKYIMFIYS